MRVRASIVLTLIFTPNAYKRITYEPTGVTVMQMFKPQRQILTVHVENVMVLLVLYILFNE